MATKNIRLTGGTNTFLSESAQSNSSYQKSADGTLLCWGQILSGEMSAGTTAKIDVTYPINFASSPKVFTSFASSAPSGKTLSVTNNSTTGCTVCFYSPVVMTGTGQALWWLAIGRWK